MRLFILLALFIVPTAAVQFYSADTFALSGKSTTQKTLFDKTGLAKKAALDKKTFIDERDNSKKSLSGQAKNKQSKRVNLMKGKRSHKGMKFLSVFLMIEGKKK